MIVGAHIDRAKDQQNLAMSQAYAVGSLVHVAFNNAKKFPKADDFLKEKSRRVVSSVQEQRAILSKIARRVD